MSAPLYVVLGRLGDALAITPLLYADYQKTGIKSQMMVAREFASFLDGCSYIDPVIFDDSYLNLEAAVKQARTLSDNVIVTSIHGTSEAVERYAYSQIKSKGRVTSSFQKEAWNLAWRLGDWDENLPLVFDKRCTERETVLLGANGFLAKGKRKPVILLALGGVTSPFPYAHLLREFVTAKFRATHRVIDLPMVAQPDGRVYDLLAVMERSALLITTDSMPLHLAWACRSLPVFALTNDRDPAGNPSLWHGAPWRPNHLWYCRYHDWPARAVEMTETIQGIGFSSAGHEGVDWFESPIVGVSLSGRSTSSDSSELLVTPGMCSREISGRPILKDVIRMAMQRGNDDSSIRLLRTGTNVSLPLILEKISACYAYRLHKGQHVPIVDLFSAPKSFWKTILPEIPDLLLDNDDPSWSQALWAIFRKRGASDQTGCCEFVGGEK